MKIDVKDNITIINSNKEVIAIISEDEIIVKDGYEAIHDVGLDE